MNQAESKTNGEDPNTPAFSFTDSEGVYSVLTKRVRWHPDLPEGLFPTIIDNAVNAGNFKRANELLNRHAEWLEEANNPIIFEIGMQVTMPSEFENEIFTVSDTKDVPSDKQHLSLHPQLIEIIDQHGTPMLVRSGFYFKPVEETDSPSE